MQSNPHSPTPAFPTGAPLGWVSAGCRQRWLLEAEATSGCVAWQLDDGTILTSEAAQVALPASPSVRFWACAGPQDTSPAGRIVSFDAHGNSLTQVNVLALRDLQFLDVSFNNLTQLDLAGLDELQGLDVDHNKLVSLEVRHLHALRILNAAGNRLTTLDLAGLDLLQILDLSNNRLVSLNLTGCTCLKDFKCSGNPVDFRRAEV